MNIIPFEGSKLPAHLARVDVAALNSDLTAHAGGGFPVISIKGKVWAIVRDKERKVLPNPLDPDAAATSIEVVLVKANKGTSKVFYAAGYDPNAGEGQKPDCYSPDGVTPAADAANKQAKTCASCKNNAWGSKVNDKGVATKGKACQDSVRMAVCPNGQLNDPHLLRVPPSSIRSLGEYGQMLAKRGVAYNMVVTKIGFDMEAESPKLTFKATGFLDESAYAQITETLDSPVVQYILGTDTIVPTVDEDADVDVEVEEAPAKPAVKAEPVAAAPAKKAPPKPVVKKPEPVTVVDEDPDFDLDGIDFSD